MLAQAEASLNGLTDAQVAASRAKYGPNRMTVAAKAGFFAKLWDQINSSLIWILLGAAVVSAGLQQWVDLGLIVAVIVLNVAIGMAQEGKAEKAAEAIKAMLAPNAMVVRGGDRKTIPAEDIVRGDLVFIQAGDRVPADLRLVTGVANLQVGGNG